MARHHFCCCLPLRLGAFLITLIQTLLNGIVAAAFIVALALNRKDDIFLTKQLLREGIVMAILYTITTFFALYAFIGVIRKTLPGIASYLYLMSFLLAMKVVLVIIEIVAVFVHPEEAVDACVGNSTDQNTIDTCKNNVKIVKALTIAAIIVPLLFEIYALIIVKQFGEKIEQDMTSSYYGRTVVPLSSSAPAPYSYEAGKASQEGLTGAGYSYPYADGHHSFGNASHA